MTQKEIVLQWLQNRPLDEVADVLLSVRSAQIDTFRAYCATLKSQIDASLAVADANQAAAKAKAQSDSQTLTSLF